MSYCFYSHNDERFRSKKLNLQGKQTGNRRASKCATRALFFCFCFAHSSLLCHVHIAPCVDNMLPATHDLFDFPSVPKVADSFNLRIHRLQCHGPGGEIAS
jgi:hypothetical protein